MIKLFNHIKIVVEVVKFPIGIVLFEIVNRCVWWVAGNDLNCAGTYTERLKLILE